LAFDTTGGCGQMALGTPWRRIPHHINQRSRAAPTPFRRPPGSWSFDRQKPSQGTSVPSFMCAITPTHQSEEPADPRVGGFTHRNPGCEPTTSWADPPNGQWWEKRGSALDSRAITWGGSLGTDGLHKFDGVGRVRCGIGVAICCPGRYGLWSGLGARPAADRYGERLRERVASGLRGTRRGGRKVTVKSPGAD